MAIADRFDGHSIHFARYASRLEKHLSKNGITCRDADLIIEESSVLYFDKVRSHEGRFFNLIRRYDPERLFVESACKAIERHLPEIRRSFGSQTEITRCIR